MLVVPCIDMMKTNDSVWFLLALIWMGLMTLLFAPYTLLWGINEKFVGSLHRYDGEKWQFLFFHTRFGCGIIILLVVPCNVMMGLMKLLVVPFIDMMRNNGNFSSTLQW